MLSKLLTFYSLFFSITIFAQSSYFVTAENGLIVRDSPNIKGLKIGKLPWGYEVQVLLKTEKKFSFSKNNSEITGEWVKIELQNYPFFISQKTTGYILDCFIENKETTIQKIKTILKNFPEFNNYSLKEDHMPFYLKGDFFSDSINDLAFLLVDSSNTVKIGIINYTSEDKTKIYFLGGSEDPLSIDNYNWVRVFKKIHKGSSLWSNYEEDFRNFEDVPESEKVKLTYDAIYIHTSESCGGGFIFWKDGKFNWLQQE